MAHAAHLPQQPIAQVLLARNRRLAKAFEHLNKASDLIREAQFDANGIRRWTRKVGAAESFGIRIFDIAEDIQGLRLKLAWRWGGFYRWKALKDRMLAAGWKPGEKKWWV